MAPKAEEQDMFMMGDNMRPNAPVSVVKAAKASLKEPSRPYTPAEGTRQLFTIADSASNRPTSSYGTPNSKLFFDGSPKLPASFGLAKLPETTYGPSAFGTSSPLRPEKPGRSILDATTFSSGLGASTSYEAAEGSPSRLVKSSSRPTAAETVAALKASMGSGERGSSLNGASPLELIRRRQSGGGNPLRPPSRPPQTTTAEDDEEDGPGEILDPHRNDDLPARPSTSRGRPSSAQPSGQSEELVLTGRFDGPAPLRMGPNAQVLGIAAGSDSDDSPDDEAYRHLYSYDVPRPAEELLSAPIQQEPAAAAHPQPQQQLQQQLQQRRSSGTSDRPPASGGSGRQLLSASPSGTPPSPPPNGEPSGDPLVAWRAAVEQSLAQLAASTSALAAAPPGPAQRDATSDLLRHTGALSAHVQYMRRQPHSSKWLNFPSVAYRDAGSGQPLTMREAIAEHVFRLMDSSNAELLLKGVGIVLRVVKSRQPLLQASKLLYRLSKDTANDRLFRSEALLEPILRTVGVMVVSSTPSSSSSSSSASSSSSSASAMHEPLVYLNGCLKNVSLDGANQKALVKLGALGAMASVLGQMAAQIDSAQAGGGGVGGAQGRGALGDGLPSASPSSSSAPATASDMASQVAVQVTGVLRNLAVASAHAPAFVSSGVLPALRAAAAATLPPPSTPSTSASSPSRTGAAPATQHDEVALNVGRILSKLSLHDACQAAIESDAAYAPLLVRLLSSFSDHRAVLVRFAFVLGNLTTASDAYRLQVAEVPGALDAVVAILARYAQAMLAEGTQQDEPAAAAAATARSQPAAEAAATQQQRQPSLLPASSEGRLSRSARHDECMVKLVRLVANLSIHVDVGPKLAARQEVVDALASLLASYSFDAAEELVLNCVCALTNLSFYHGAPDNRVLAAPPPSLLRYVTPLLMCDNDEAQVEAARAFGNFSRVPAARTYMRESRVLDALLLLLDANNLELLYSVCGTLVNFSAERDCREALVSLGGVGRLVEVMERAATAPELTDVEVGILGVVFKALYNICAADATPGEQLPPTPAVTEDEIAAIQTIAEHVRGSDEWAECEEVLQLSDRCSAQLQLISRKFESLNLEPLS